MTTVGPPSALDDAAAPPSARGTAGGSVAEAWPLRRAGAVAAYAALTASWCAAVGVPTDRALVCVWLALGLAAFSVGRAAWHRPLLDWSPFIVFFVAYQNTRGLAWTLGLPTMWELPIAVDRWLGGGTLPTVWLQERLLPADGGVAWWEVPLSVVYMSHFYVSFVLAAVLWRRHRRDFGRFVRRLMVVLGVAVCVYVAVPTAPPWAAASCSAAQVADRPISPACMDTEPSPGQQTLLGPIAPEREGNPDHVQRLTARGFSEVPGSSHVVNGAVGVGLNMANPVAAVPSLHAACSMLASAFLWRRVRRGWRPLLAAYPVAMAFTLVWTADHYVFDVLAGWAVVALACGADRALERRRSSRSVPLPR